ncbi:MAG: hypothetical protein GQ477_02590 [Nanohaloarchaea archaeon]|nr:hypothetical protein [Candidatus Nanohaloarchaea archaeon]
MILRKQILTIILFLSIIFVSGCTQQQDSAIEPNTFSLDTTYKTGLIPQCESGLIDRDSCYLDIAIKTRNVSYCFKVNGQESIPGCITRYAIKTDDVTACTTSYMFTDRSRMRTLTDDYRYRCYYDYAFAKDDRSICNLMDPQNEEAKLLKSYCLAVFVKDTDACSNLEVDYYLRDRYDKIQGDCHIDIAKKTKDVTLCDSALEKENGPYGPYFDRQMDGVFISDCYSQVAPAVDNKDLCDKAKTYPYKYIPCVGAFIQPGEVTDFCSTYRPDFIFSYNMDAQCVKDLVAEKDISFCSNIQDRKDRIQCLDTLCSPPYTGCKDQYRTVLDETTCDETTTYDLNTKSEDYGRIWSGYSGGACITDIAKKTANPDLCETITNEAYRNKCYVDYAHMTEDVKYCATLTITEARSECYTPFAVDAMDETYCQKIDADATIIQPCLAKIASIIGQAINATTELTG